MSKNKNQETQVEQEEVLESADIQDTNSINVEEMQAEIEKQTKLADENRETAQRLRADFENFKKRNASLAEESKQNGRLSVLETILPVLDNCDRAKSMIGDESALEGFELLEKQLLEVLQKFEVEEIIAKGEEFDAKFMEAVMREENAEMEGKVLEVFTKGYKIKDKVLRFAVVKVGC